MNMTQPKVLKEISFVLTVARYTQKRLVEVLKELNEIEGADHRDHLMHILGLIDQRFDFIDRELSRITDRLGALERKNPPMMPDREQTPKGG